MDDIFPVLLILLLKITLIILTVYATAAFHRYGKQNKSWISTFILTIVKLLCWYDRSCSVYIHTVSSLRMGCDWGDKANDRERDWEQRFEKICVARKTFNTAFDPTGHYIVSIHRAVENNISRVSREYFRGRYVKCCVVYAFASVRWNRTYYACRFINLVVFPQVLDEFQPTINVAATDWECTCVVTFRNEKWTMIKYE